MESLTQEIKAKARQLGFSEVGVARAERLETEGGRLAEWLARGYHGTMEWMSRNLDRRLDPRAVLPDARSVIAVALNYFSDTVHSEDPGTGKISRYAWGDDYHDVMKDRLEELLSFVRQKCPGVSAKLYVDTGPVLEKVWAQRAGIGWEGKHTNVITRDYGSWVFLGEILVSIELEYDAPATDHCGSCTRCIEACPTQAIVEPYVLDSNRCISYLTIEHRGEIPESLAEQFDRWVYGCDICQDVCPWNSKFSEPTSLEEFHPRDGNAAPGLEEWAKMTKEEFSRKFYGSAMKRTKHGGLVRNVLEVLGREESAGKRGERISP